MARSACPTIGRKYDITGASVRVQIGEPEDFDFDYTTPGPFCRVDRLREGRCATQLNFVKGTPKLRLCSKYGDPGKLVPVKDAQDAQRKAEKFCATHFEGLEDLDGLDGLDGLEDLDDFEAPSRPLPPIMQGESGSWIMLLGSIGALFGMVALMNANKR